MNAFYANNLLSRMNAGHLVINLRILGLSCNFKRMKRPARMLCIASKVALLWSIVRATIRINEGCGAIFTV